MPSNQVGVKAVDLGELITKKGIITPEQLLEATETRDATGQRLDRVLLRLGFIDERELLEVLGQQLSIPLVELADETIDVELVKSVPAKLVHRRRILPMRRENDMLIVATSDPFDIYALDELRALTGLPGGDFEKIKAVLATEGEITTAIKQYFGVGGQAIDEMMDGQGGDLEVIDETDQENGDLLEMAQEATVVKLVNEIIREAIAERASDVHFESAENDLRIRYRIDGVLHTTNVPAQIRRFHAAIISRIKIMSSLNIAEKRLPQDGGFKIRYQGREIDIRVSIIPSVYGEGVVLRILDKGSLLLSLTDLGMDQDNYSRFSELIKHPHGIMLVTGPTGSGKTTTLYAALSAIVSDRIKVITVEDPVEYHLQGINQIQVLPKIGLTFAAGLRSILRHDPDVLMIGEIRDLETAEAAIQAALTGHLVFSTLHTNDACSANTRLLDMGVEPFLVASSVEGMMAQRLVRTICPNCKEPYKPDVETFPKDFQIEQGAVLYRGKGCRECRHTGLKGRIGMFELAVVTDRMRDKILRRASAGELQKLACKEGMKTLRQDGWDKVRAGLTIPEEVLRVTVAS